MKNVSQKNLFACALQPTASLSEATLQTMHAEGVTDVPYTAPAPSVAGTGTKVKPEPVPSLYAPTYVAVAASPPRCVAVAFSADCVIV